MSKLFECVEILDSKRIPLSSKVREGLAKIYPYYGAQGIVDYVDNYLFDGDYILVAEDGNNLKTLSEPITTWATGRFWVNNHAHILGEKKGYCLKYIYYLLTCMDLRGYITGSAQPKFNQENLANVELRLPELSQQISTAKILSVLDDKIINNNFISTTLESMAKTLFDYWFTQFDFPNEEGRPYRSSGGAMEWNEQLKREIPKGWKVCAIGNLLSKVPNTTRIQTGEYLKTGRIPVIDQSTDYIAGYTNDENAALASDGGYVVFGDHTRIVKYIRFPFARGADGTQVLKSNTSCVPDELLYQIVKGVDLSNYGYARHFKFLKDTLAVVPNGTVATKYAQIVTPIHDKQVQLTFENVELTKIRDWLLPMLMNGQATVR